MSPVPFAVDWVAGEFVQPLECPECKCFMAVLIKTNPMTYEQMLIEAKDVRCPPCGESKHAVVWYNADLEDK